MILTDPIEVYYYYMFLYFLICIYMIELQLILDFISIYYQILQEPGKELQVPRGGNATSHSKVFDGINFDKLGRTFKQLHDRFSELDDSPFQIDLPLDLFHQAGSISVYADDYAALLTPREWLTIPVVQIWML